MNSGATTPLDTLPDELFSCILILEVSRPQPTVEDYPDSDSEDGYARPKLEGWARRVELMTVCKKWRRVALGCPAFWTGICLHPHLRALSKMLPRWKKAPRTVKICLSLDPDSRLLKNIRRLLVPAQLGELSVIVRRDTDARMEEIVDLLPQKKPPALHSLSLSAFPGAAETLRIRDDFFTAYVKGLQHLKLSYCRVDWDTLVSKKGSNVGLRNLLTLHLRCLETPPPSDVFNSILNSSQNLQDLSVENALPEDFTATFKWTNPTLKRCTLLRGAESTVALLLRVLAMPYPVPSELRITCTLSDRSYGANIQISRLASEAITSFARFINQSARLRGKVVELDDDKYTAAVALWERDHRGARVRHSVLQIDRDAMASPLIKQVFVPKAEYMWLQAIIWQDAQDDDWVRFFENHPKLRILRFRPLEHIADVLPLLSRSVYDVDAEASVSPVLPKLRMLSIQPGYPAENFTASFLEALAATLVARQKIGLPVAKVEYFEMSKTGQDELVEMKKRIPSELAEIVVRRWRRT